jgi:myosin heavy subunit
MSDEQLQAKGIHSITARRKILRSFTPSAAISHHVFSDESDHLSVSTMDSHLGVSSSQYHPSHTPNRFGTAADASRAFSSMNSSVAAASSDVSGTILELQSRVTSSDHSVQQLTSRLKQLEADNAFLRGTSAQLERALAEARQFAVDPEELRNLHATVEELRHQASSSQAEARRLQDDLTSKLLRSESQVEQLSRLLHSRDEHTQRVEQQLKVHQEEHQQQQQQLHSQQQQLQEQQADFQRQSQELKHQLQSRHSEVDQLRQRLNQLQQQHQLDQEELQRLKRAEESAAFNMRQESLKRDQQLQEQLLQQQQQQRPPTQPQQQQQHRQHHFDAEIADHANGKQQYPQLASPTKGYAVVSGQQPQAHNLLPQQQKQQQLQHRQPHQSQTQMTDHHSQVPNVRSSLHVSQVGGANGVQVAASFHAESKVASNGAFSPNALFEQRQKLLEEQVPFRFWLHRVLFDVFFFRPAFSLFCIRKRSFRHSFPASRALVHLRFFDIRLIHLAPPLQWTQV